MVNAATLFFFYMIADEGYDNTYVILPGIIFTVFSLKMLPPLVFMFLHYKAFNPRTIKPKVLQNKFSNETSTEISARNFEFIQSSEFSENLVFKNQVEETNLLKNGL